MTLVFSVEIYLNQIIFKKVGVVQPSISVSIAKNNPEILWTSEDKVHDGQSILIDRAYQIMVTTDVFDAINSWKFGINLTMIKDQVPLGTCTFEFKPLIASALASCGASPFISNQGAIRDFQKEIVAIISFNARIIYYPGSEHKNTVEIFLSRPLEREPPHDTYFKPLLQSSASVSQKSSSSLSISVDMISASDTESDLLGTHNSYRDASEANKSRLEAATKNFNSQITSIKRASTQASPRINNDNDNNKTNENNNYISFTKTTNTSTIHTMNTDNNNNSISSNNSTASHISSNNASNNFSSSKKLASDIHHVQISTSTLNSALGKSSKVISTDNHFSLEDDDFVSDE